MIAAYFGIAVYGTVLSLLGAFARAHPGISIRLDRMAKNDQADAVHDGPIHVGFSRLYKLARDVVTINIVDEPQYAAVGRDHALSNRSSITMATLADEPLLAG